MPRYWIRFRTDHQTFPRAHGGVCMGVEIDRNNAAHRRLQMTPQDPTPTHRFASKFDIVPDGYFDADTRYLVLTDSLRSNDAKLGSMMSDGFGKDVKRLFASKLNQFTKTGQPDLHNVAFAALQPAAMAVKDGSSKPLIDTLISRGHAATAWGVHVDSGMLDDRCFYNGRYFIPGNWHVVEQIGNGKTPTTYMDGHCIPSRFHMLIDDLRPDVVITVGKVSGAYCADGLLDLNKNSGLVGTRSMDMSGGSVHSFQHYAIKKLIYTSDLKALGQCLSTDSDRKLWSTTDHMCAVVSAKPELRRTVIYDIETYQQSDGVWAPICGVVGWNADPAKPHDLTMSVFRKDEMHSLAQMVAQARYVIGHNIIDFDNTVLFTKHEQAQLQKKTSDTIRLAHLLGIRKRSLEALAARFGIASDWKHRSKDATLAQHPLVPSSAAFSEPRHVYCMMDVAATWHLWLKLTEMVSNTGIATASQDFISEAGGVTWKVGYLTPDSLMEAHDSRQGTW